MRNLVDQTVARFGRLDVAVNNAGTEGKPGPITDQTAESYAATFDTNVLGTLLSMKHELRVMQAQGSGSIINISSTYGHEGGAGASVYAASKHAVEGITKSAALEARELRAFASMPSRLVRPRPACSTASPEPRRKKRRLRSSVPLGACRRPGGDRARRSSSSRRTKHRSSPAKYSASTAARPPAEGNSRFHASDSTGITQGSARTYYDPHPINAQYISSGGGVQWLTW